MTLTLVTAVAEYFNVYIELTRGQASILRARVVSWNTSFSSNTTLGSIMFAFDRVLTLRINRHPTLQFKNKSSLVFTPLLRTLQC